MAELDQADSASTETSRIALRSVIVYGGPGSWKRGALRDEYVATIHN